MKEIKKPKIGDKVYIRSSNNGGCIFEETVGFLGTESFVLEGFQTMDVDDTEQFYCDYNFTWFTNLAKAKKYLLSEARELYGGGRWKIVEEDNGVWSAEEY